MDLVLKDRVLNYILEKEKGVTIVELERIFGESRMRLGYIITKLEEEKKILKSGGNIRCKPP